MSKLTAEKCRNHIDRLTDGGEQRCLSIYEEDYLQALEIALPVLEQQGGWISCSDRMPSEEGKYITFGSYGVGCSFYHSVPRGMVFRDCETSVDENSGTDWADEVFTVTHWQTMPSQPSTTPQIDNDGWIDWYGGKCPVSPKTIVSVKYRKGKIESPGEAVGYFWDHGYGTVDIIAYRVIENDGGKP